MKRPGTNASLIFLLFSLLCGCHGATGISGDVTDLDGVPIGGATITVTPLEAFKDIVRRPHVATTREDGGFDLGFTHRPVRVEYTMTVTHKGYVEHKEAITNGPHNNRVIRLKPVPDEE